MIRAQNAHAYVNAGFLFEFNKSHEHRAIVSCRICYGGINPGFTHAIETENTLKGSNDLYTNEGLQEAISALEKDLQPDWVLPDASPIYRKNLAIALFYRFVLSTTSAHNQLKFNVRSASEQLQRGLSSGIQTYGTIQSEWPLTQAIPKYEGRIQTSGEAIYVNDLQIGRGDPDLWIAFVPTTVVGKKIVKIDTSEALVDYQMKLWLHLDHHFLVTILISANCRCAQLPVCQRHSGKEFIYSTAIYKNTKFRIPGGRKDFC